MQKHSSLMEKLCVCPCFWRSVSKQYSMSLKSRSQYKFRNSWRMFTVFNSLSLSSRYLFSPSVIFYRSLLEDHYSDDVEESSLFLSENQNWDRFSGHNLGVSAQMTVKYYKCVCVCVCVWLLFHRFPQHWGICVATMNEPIWHLSTNTLTHVKPYVPSHTHTHTQISLFQGRHVTASSCFFFFFTGLCKTKNPGGYVRSLNSQTIMIH